MSLETSVAGWQAAVERLGGLFPSPDSEYDAWAELRAEAAHEEWRQSATEEELAALLSECPDLPADDPFAGGASVSIHTTAYHVLVPSVLTYYVEADSADEAEQRVWDAINPRRNKSAPTDPTVMLLADRTEQKEPPWDVTDPSDHGECGCDQCVGHYDRD